MGAPARGIFCASPDRGYNVAGTIDCTARRDQIAMQFSPAATGASGQVQNQIQLSLTQSTLLYEKFPGGGTRPMSGIDPAPGSQWRE